MFTNKIIICTDQPATRNWLCGAMAGTDEFEVISNVRNTSDVIGHAFELQPNLVVLNLDLPDAIEIETIVQLHEVAPNTRVLILNNQHSENHIFKVLRAGASGYLFEGGSRNELLAAFRLALHGGIALPRALNWGLICDQFNRATGSEVRGYELLSPRERDVLQLIAEGRANRAIAKQLFISVRTVERIRSSIMNKLGLEARAELLTYAVRFGFLAQNQLH